MVGYDLNGQYKDILRNNSSGLLLNVGKETLQTPKYAEKHISYLVICQCVLQQRQMDILSSNLNPLEYFFFCLVLSSHSLLDILNCIIVTFHLNFDLHTLGLVQSLFRSYSLQ